MRLRKIQLGCLIALLLFVSLGFITEYFGKRTSPSDNEGAGGIPVVGLIGLLLFFLIFGLIGIIQAVIRHFHRDPPGFPLDNPIPPDDPVDHRQDQP
jgi:hypothetical protein